MANFTEGPWIATKEPDGYLLSHAAGGWIFELRDRRKDPEPDLEFLETQDANAALIAAAPEMYETLRTIAAFAVGHGDVCEIIARRARAALHKADGQ